VGQTGNQERANKHYILAAKAGYTISKRFMDVIKSMGDSKKKILLNIWEYLSRAHEHTKIK